MLRTVAFIYKHDKIDISYFKSYLSFLLIFIFNFLIFFHLLQKEKQNSFIKKISQNSSFNLQSLTSQ